MGNTTWSLNSILQTGVYKGFLRIYNTTSNMDYPVTLIVNSTIGIEELELPITYKVYDWYGRYMGNSLEGLKGFYIVKYNNNKVEKVFIQ
jgi:hypothetical protein